MMQGQANAVMTKARAMYGRRLTAAQFSELARRQSVQEISAYLRERTPYRSVLEGVQDSTIHRGQLENLLRKEVLYKYVRLAKYAGNKNGIYRYIVMDLEIELILFCLRDLFSPGEKDFFAGLPAFIRPYACFDIYALAGAKSITELTALLADTPYGPVLREILDRPRTKELTLTDYELALRKFYFETQLKQVKQTMHGSGAQQLREMILTRAEMMNLNTIFRLKTYFHAPAEQIRDKLLPLWLKLTVKKREALLAARDTQEFMRLLTETPYGRQIDPEDMFIENQTDRIRHQLDHKLLRFSTDPQVVYTAYMLLSSMETENIIRIIEGVRYSLPPERIESLLYKI